MVISLHWGDPDYVSVTELEFNYQELSQDDNYYIDTILQPYVPTLPSESESLKIGDTAMIGYVDTIDTCSYISIDDEINIP